MSLKASGFVQQRQRRQHQQEQQQQQPVLAAHVCREAISRRMSNRGNNGCFGGGICTLPPVQSFQRLQFLTIANRSGVQYRPSNSCHWNRATSVITHYVILARRVSVQRCPPQIHQSPQHQLYIQLRCINYLKQQQQKRCQRQHHHIGYFKKNLMLHSDVRELDVPLPELVNNNVDGFFQSIVLACFCSVHIFKFIYKQVSCYNYNSSINPEFWSMGVGC